MCCGLTGYIGYYHELGYNIWSMREGTLFEELYTAGNSMADSILVVEIKDGLDLYTIQKYCDQTGHEMADEEGVPWLGCTREDNPYV